MCWCCLEPGKEKELPSEPSLAPAPQSEGLCAAVTTSQHPTVPTALLTAEELEVVEPFLSPQHLPVNPDVKLSCRMQTVLPSTAGCAVVLVSKTLL